MNETILTVGAAGKSAGLVIPALKARGTHVRGFVRKAGDAATAVRNGADEIASGDLADAAAVAAGSRVSPVSSTSRRWRCQEAETGAIGEPWSNETRFSRVDYRDVAEVAAIALTEDRLLYRTYELCAEGWLRRPAWPRDALRRRRHGRRPGGGARVSPAAARDRRARRIAAPTVGPSALH